MVDLAEGGGGVPVIPSLSGTEFVSIDNGGPTPTRTTTQDIADLGGGGGPSLLLESGADATKGSDLPILSLTGLAPSDVYVYVWYSGASYRLASKNLIQLLGIRGIGANSIQIGQGANASGTNSIAIGVNAFANSESSIAIGIDAAAQSPYTVAIGPGASASAGYYALAVGRLSAAIGPSAVAIGEGSHTSNRGVAVGSQANTTALNAVAIGPSALGSGVNSTAVGKSANANGANSAAIGAVVTTTANSIALNIGGSTGSVVTRSATANVYTAVP